jgi:predicted aldo/keto reductase-like oxidoreductase
MIQRFRFGLPLPTDSVVQEIPVSAGPVPFLTAEEDGWAYRMAPDAIVYGLGEMPRGINKRGWHYVTNNTDEARHSEDKLSYYGAHNFLLIDGGAGRECFGVFIDFPGKVRYDIGYTEYDALRFATEEPDHELYIITGDDLNDISRQFRQLIGRSYIPPKWAFGLAQSRFGYKTAEDVREVARQYKENDLPLDMICMDIDYMQDYADFTVNKQRFPDLAALSAELKAQGIRLVPIIDAGVRIDPKNPVCAEGLANGYFCTKADGTIDEERAEALLNTAKAAGVNYFDTAYPYHNGQSEPFVGRVIAKWDRSSFYLATKMPLWKCKSLDDAKRIFEEQLQRLGVDYIDFYLLHSLHKARYEKAKAMGLVDWLWQQKAAGRIRNFGFSCHDNSAGFEYILRDQPWDFCQLQYNYLDTDDRAEEISGDRGYQLTEECGVPLIIMEPIKGGTLASLPADAAAPLHALRPDATDASWALRWVGSHKNVHVILSGMSAEDQLTDNLATFDHFEPLSPAENAAVESVANELHRRIKIGCTGCRYCMPCPMGVDIPDNFSIWNKLGMFGQKDAIKAQWTTCFPDSEKALHCVRCGKCEAVCPQKLPIRDSLAQLQKELDAL